MEKIWHPVFDYFDLITDNVYAVIIMLSITAAIIIHICKKLIGCLLKVDIHVIFGPVSMLFTLFVAHMTTHLPVLHPRMYLALRTVSGIVYNSSDYITNFENTALIRADSSKAIASYLYELNAAERSKWFCKPTQIYDSLFRTMEQIRGGMFLPDVHDFCFGSAKLIFIMVVVVIILMGYLLLSQKNISIFQITWYFISVLFVLWMCMISNGAAVCAILMWISSALLTQLFEKNGTRT